ncbi:hypothetical protein SAMN05216604_11966 [Pseudomonas agarici]|nr:hypothetical protein SAMN05216604_11966 [Pseudomonas agarici]
MAPYQSPLLQSWHRNGAIESPRQVTDQAILLAIAGRKPERVRDTTWKHSFIYCPNRLKGNPSLSQERRFGPGRPLPVQASTRSAHRHRTL